MALALCIIPSTSNTPGLVLDSVQFRYFKDPKIVEDLKNELWENLNNETIGIDEAINRINEENKSGNISWEEAQELFKELDMHYGEWEQK